MARKCLQKPRHQTVIQNTQRTLRLSSKKTNNLIPKNGPKTLTDTSAKKVHRWLTGWEMLSASCSQAGNADESGSEPLPHTCQNDPHPEHRVTPPNGNYDVEQQECPFTTGGNTKRQKHGCFQICLSGFSTGTERLEQKKKKELIKSACVKMVTTAASSVRG